MGENNTETTFKCGDLVFAKLADYPPWPAKISEIDDGKKFKVVLFATCNEAIVDLDHIYAYVDNKEHFKADQEKLRIQYDEAVEQIERVLQYFNAEQNCYTKLGSYVKPKVAGQKVEENKPGDFQFKVPKAVNWNYKRVTLKLPKVDQLENNATSFVAGPWLHELTCFNKVHKKAINGAAAAAPDAKTVRAERGCKRPPSPSSPASPDDYLDLEDCSTYFDSDDDDEPMPIKRRVSNEGIAAQHPLEDYDNEDDKPGNNTTSWINELPKFNDDEEDSSSDSSSDDEPLPIKRRVPNEGIAAQHPMKDFDNGDDKPVDKPDNNTTSWINELPSFNDDEEVSFSDSSSDDDDEPMPIKRRVPIEAIAAQPDNNTTSVVGGPWINELSVDDDDDDDDGDGDGDDDDDKEDIINPILGERENRSHIIENNFLLVYMPSAKCYGIDLTFEKPNSFLDSAAEDDWMRNSNEQAIQLKVKMLSGLIDVDAMPGRIVCNPKRDQITADESLQFIDELVMQKYSLREESCFVRLSEKVRSSLGFRRAHADWCLEVLRELQSIEFNKLLLLRNPGCVDIVRHLRAYIGNCRSWNLSAADRKDFKKKTRVIRQVAQFIYMDMVRVFFPKCQSDSGFWIKYCERVLVYENYIDKHRVRAGLWTLGHNKSN